MISINYQTYGSKGLQVRLRFYLDGETRFINVTKLLKGNLVKKHWNPRKKCFYPGAPYSGRTTTSSWSSGGSMMSMRETGVVH